MRVIQKLKAYNVIQVFVIYLRYLIGFAWVFASIVKIQGKRFTMSDGINSSINSAWHMFETLYQSGLYWQFIGWSQLIVGGILLTQRFSFLGAILGLPIALNIFFITISYEFGGTYIITFLMLLGNIFLLIWDYKLLRVLLEPKFFEYPQPDIYSLLHSRNWIYLGIFYFVATIILRVFFFYSLGIVIGCSVFILIGLLIMVITYRKYKKIG